MANEPTVLVVSSADLAQALVSQLEGAGVFVETTSPAELSGIFTVVGPDLVVHVGGRLWEEVATYVAGGPDPRRVRVVAVVDRNSMMEVRKKNRAIVVSVLSDDMPTKTLVERIVLLAQKSAQQAKTGERGGGSSLIPLASFGTAPPPSPRVSPSPAAPPPPPLAAPAAAAPALPPPALPPPVVPAPALAAPVIAVPRVSVPRAEKPLVSRAAPLERAPGAKPPLAAAAAPQAAAAPARPAASPLSLGRRLALIDDDVTRGDAVATALRALGYQVQLYPSDPARTRWAVLRKFGPELIVTDGNTAPQPVWLELLRADAHLKSAEVVTAPYRKLYDELNGSLQLQSLLSRLDDVEASSADDRETTIPADFPPAEKPPALSSDSSLHEAESDEETKTFTVDASVLPRKAFADSAPPPPPHEEALDFAGLVAHASRPAPPTTNPVTLSSESSSDSAISAAAVSVTSRTGAPSKPRSRARPLFAAVTLLAVVGGGYAALRGGVLPTSPGPRPPAPSAAQAPVPAPSASARPAPAAAPADSATAQAHAADPAPAGADPWKGAERPAPSCEQLVPDTSDLRKGDVAQSGLFWDKARSALVLGDSAQAHAHLCRAVLVYGQSLAVEALVEVYLTQHAPSVAKTWIDVALAARPGRPKTLELAGDVECQLGNLAAARDFWARALSVQPTDQKTLDAVAKQLVFEGNQALRSSNPARAEIVLLRAFGLSPTRLDAAEALARVFTEQGDHERSAFWAARAKPL